MKPTVWAEFSLAPMMATLRREGIRPPIADPLDMVPRYFSGKEPKIAATPPEKKDLNLFVKNFKVVKKRGYYQIFSKRI